MKNLFDMTGKVVLITGGSRGLGRAMAQGFAEAGADLAIVSRSLESCEKAAAELEPLGGRAFPYSCHVAKWDELDRMVEAVYAHFGKVDVLINNAGMSPLAPSSLETSEELFDKVIGVNFKGPFRLCALVGTRMVKDGGGAIINVSSGGSLRPQPLFGPYAGAKAGLNAITTAFAFEYGPSVRVNNLMAGPFHTDATANWSRDQKAGAGSALQRIGRPEEVITTALYLASEHSSYTTAAVIKVDGGLP